MTSSLKISSAKVIYRISPTSLTKFCSAEVGVRRFVTCRQRRYFGRSFRVLLYQRFRVAVPALRAYIRWNSGAAANRPNSRRFWIRFNVAKLWPNLAEAHFFWRRIDFSWYWVSRTSRSCTSLTAFSWLSWISWRLHRKNRGRGLCCFGRRLAWQSSRSCAVWMCVLWHRTLSYFSTVELNRNGRWILPYIRVQFWRASRRRVPTKIISMLR